MHPSRRRGFTLMEVVIAVAIVFVILTVALPNFASARINTNEVNVIRMIGTIHTAQAQFQSQTGRFAVALSELNKLMPARLAAGHHSGYHFVLGGTTDGYLVTAVPEKPGGTGYRSFRSDQSLTVFDGEGKEVGH